MRKRAVKTIGIECPIIREGDDIISIVIDSVLKEMSEPQFKDFNTANTDVYDDEGNFVCSHHDINDKDIIGITESVVARAAGQFITVDDIAEDIKKKFGENATVCLINPIYSRNRFSMILKGIARAAKKVIIIMPEKDEVGNPRGVNKFTGVNICNYYDELCMSENCECEIYKGVQDCKMYLKELVCNSIDCRLHIKGKTNYKYSLADICSDKSPDWGVLGTNKSTDERLKLFPSIAECKRVCESVKVKIKEATGRDVIVCVYGDGCFKDPVGGIYEFADPTTMPYYTDSDIMESTPNEIKLKSLIDSSASNAEVRRRIEMQRSQKSNLVGKMSSMGTTPRVIRDLVASLMDLNSGSGDRCTPVVLVQNYV